MSCHILLIFVPFVVIGVIIPPSSVRSIIARSQDETSASSSSSQNSVVDEYARLLSMGYTDCTNSTGNCELMLTALLFANYSKLARPVQNDRNITYVKLNPGFMCLIELQEVTQTITLNMWMRVQWNDEFLVWNPEDFGGVEKLAVPLNMVWIPDIVIYQELSRVEPMREEMRRVTIDYKGQIRFYYPAVHRLFCSLQMARFPFDRQKCLLRFGPWYHDSDEMQIHSKYEKADTRMFVASTEWLIEGVDIAEREITYLTKPVTEVTYTINLKRHPTFYLSTLVTPTVLIMTVAIIGLFSPSNSTHEREEKVSMGITTLLTLAVLLLMVSDQLPKSADDIPLMAIFMLVQLLICSMATITTVIIITLHRRNVYGKRVPRWLQNVTCERPMHKRKFTPTVIPALMQIDKTIYASNLIEDQWFKMTNTLDKIARYFYLALCFLSVVWFLINGLWEG